MFRFKSLPFAAAACLVAGAVVGQDRVAIILPQEGVLDAWTNALETGLSEMLDQNGFDADLYSFSPYAPETLRTALESAELDGVAFALVPELRATEEAWLSEMGLDADILSGGAASDGESGLLFGHGWWSGGRNGPPLIAVPGNHTVTLSPATVSLVDFDRALRDSSELFALQSWIENTTEGRDLTEALTLVPRGYDNTIEIRPLPVANEGGCGCDSRFGTSSTCDPDGWVIDPGALGFDNSGAMILNESDDDGCGCDGRLNSLPQFMAAPELQVSRWSDRWDAARVLADAEAAHFQGRTTIIMVCDPD